VNLDNLKVKLFSEVPDFFRVMLHPSGLWEVLGELLLGDAEDFSFMVE